MSLAHDKLVEFLQALIREPSLSGEEAAVAARVAAEMGRLGFDEVYTDAYGSVAGVVHGACSGPTLLLDAHVDTVGMAPGVEWQHSPYSADIRAGRLFGRGTSDMKGALAAMIHAAAALDRSRLAGRVAVSATVLEEVMEGVALAALMEWLKPDCVIVGEATELNINHGGRGRAEIHLETIGRPAHSSSPHLGDNAVYHMLPAIAAIRDLAMPADPLLGPALMELTDIVSDPYPGASVVPSRCRVTFDRRLLPGETPESVVSGLAALPSLGDVRIGIAEGRHSCYTGAVLSAPKFFPAWKLDPAHPLVRQAIAGLRSAGQAPKLGAYRFCTNAAASAGRLGVPTIGYGPSSEGQAHVIDEFIEVDQLFAAAEGYKAIIRSVLA